MPRKSKKDNSSSDEDEKKVYTSSSEDVTTIKMPSHKQNKSSSSSPVEKSKNTYVSTNNQAGTKGRYTSRKSSSSEEKPRAKGKKKDISSSSEDSYEGPIVRRLFNKKDFKSSSSEEVKPKKKEEFEDSEDSSSDAEIDEDFKSNLPQRTLLLPADIMSRIAEFTNSIDLLNTMSTNSTMNLMKYKIPIDLSDKPIKLNNLKKYAETLSKYKITGLNLTGTNKVKNIDKISTSIINKLTKLHIATYGDLSNILTDVNYNNITSFTYEGNFNASVKNIIMSMPNLVSLNLSIRGNYAHRLKFWHKLPKLRRLTIEGNVNVDLRKAVSLVYLNIGKNYGRNSFVTNINFCIQIETLILKSVNMGGILDLSSLVNLRYLSLIDMGKVEGLIGISDNIKLEKIEIKNTTVPILNVSNCSNLKHLSLYKVKSTTVESLSQCHMLESIEVSGEVFFTFLCGSLKYFSCDNNS